MANHRRLRVFDQVECTEDFDPTKGLYCEKGKRFFVCEVRDPEPFPFRVLRALITGGSTTLQEEDYGIKIMGVDYPDYIFHRASSFRLINVMEQQDLDKVEALRRGEYRDPEDHQDEK